MSSLEKMKLLLATVSFSLFISNKLLSVLMISFPVIFQSSEQSFVKDFKKWVVPFLDRVEKRDRGSKAKLIQQYMTETSKVCFD